MANPTLDIAQTTSMNACDPIGFPTAAGYVGLASVHELADAASLSFDSSGRTVMFGTESSSCASGLLVYRQSDRYGVLRFIAISTDESVNVEYWIGELGVTDFRNAP